MVRADDCGTAFGEEAVAEREADAKPPLVEETVLPSEREAPLAAAPRIVIVHPSRLFRDCLKRALVGSVDNEIYDLSSIDKADIEIAQNETALFVVGLNSFSRSANSRSVEELVKWAGDTPVVVTGDSEEPKLVAELLSNGVRGYLPTSLDLEVWCHALRLVLAGGTFAPAASFLKLSNASSQHTGSANDRIGLTTKQLAVIDAIRRGKANKTIAYELNMCESTVKVHVRTIMKKLQAKNRTQVAYIANELLRDHSPEA